MTKHRRTVVETREEYGVEYPCWHCKSTGVEHEIQYGIAEPVSSCLTQTHLYRVGKKKQGACSRCEGKGYRIVWREVEEKDA